MSVASLASPRSPTISAVPSIQISVNVELQKVARRIARTTGRLRHDTGKPGGGKVKPINKRINEPYRIVRGDVIVNRLRQQQHLTAVVTGNVRHAGFYRAGDRAGILSARVSTRSVRFLHTQMAML